MLKWVSRMKPDRGLGPGLAFDQKSKSGKRLLVFLFLVFSVVPASAAIIVPGADGTDGALHITEDTVMDLSLAGSGAWNEAPATPGEGVYDSDKWAVVFKYTSVTIDEGATLSFSNHLSRAPVVWLVSGNVTINGTLDLNGKSYVTSPNTCEPGPGGFRGGFGTYSTGVGAGAGFGPGGGERAGEWGAGASYGTSGGNGPAKYGNQSLIPLIGGSGGGSDPRKGLSGGAGGGAIMIACQNSLTVNGKIRANGGSGYRKNDNWNRSSGGSGGGIRLVADTLSGNGTIHALGGGGYQSGGLGRIRIERVINDNTLQVIPDASLLNLTGAPTALLWPPDGAPTVKIISIGDEPSPDDPRAAFGTVGADVVLPEVSTTQVVVETRNVEEASQVQVRVTPQFNASYTAVTAAVDEVVSTEPLVIRWIADLPVRIGYSAVQVKVVRP